MKKHIIAIVALVLAGTAIAQNDRFPIGPFGITAGPSGSMNWQNERENLLNLGVNHIEGVYTKPETLYFQNICEATNGQITMTLENSPYDNYQNPHLWEIIRSWGFNPATRPADWKNFLYVRLQSFKDRYCDRPGFGNILIGHEFENFPYLSQYQWAILDSAIDYSFQVWHDQIAPQEYRNRAVYIGNINGVLLYNPTFFEQVTNIRQYEFDWYPWFSTVPVPDNSFYTNPSNYYAHQNALDYFVRGSDSALKYIEKSQNDARWFCIIQSGKYSEGVYVTRWPTKEEIRAQAWVALARGAKGVKYFPYFSSDPIASGGKYWGLVTYERWSRSKYEPNLLSYSGSEFDNDPNYRIYDWLKELNDTLNALSQVLTTLKCQAAFRYDNLPIDCYIKQIQVPDTIPGRTLFYDASIFKGTDQSDYFMVINRHCVPSDTVNLFVTVNYTPAPGQPNTYFISDVLHNKPLTGQLPANQNQTFSVKLQPGGGRLLRIVPFASAPKINNGAGYTNFKFSEVAPNVNALLTKDSINIIQKYWINNINQDTMQSIDFLGYWASKSTGWLPYSEAIIQYLEKSDKDKENQFDIQYKIGGNILTPHYSAQIYFNDDLPAQGAVKINNDAVFTNDQNVAVKVSGTDAFPGLYQMRFAEAPFGNDSGYVNLVKNGCFEDTTDWIKQAANLDSGYAVISRSSVLGVPQFEDYGNYIAQEVPMPKAGQLVRLKADLYGKIDEIPAIQVYGIYNDTLEPRIKYYLNKNIYDAEFLFTGNTVLNDTFTFIPPTDGTIAKMIVLIGYPGIMAVQVPAIDAIIPQPVILHSNIYIDNIFLEPVELKTGAQPDAIPPISSYIYDGWDYADTNNSLSYKLSPVDGTKRVYMQLNDLAGNNSLCPGWSDTIVLDMTVPVAGITSPVNMSYVNGTISIRGYAWDVHFANWVLEFKKNSAETWGQLSSGTSPIHYKFPQTLCRWNTTTVPDGQYYLRLTAADKASNVRADTLQVRVSNDGLPPDAIKSSLAAFNSLPVDACTDAQGNMYVSDTQSNQVWKFSPMGDSLLCFGYRSTGQDTTGFSQPAGITVDDSGFIWVADCYNSKVKKFSHNGTLLLSFGSHGNGPGQFKQPTGIVLDGTNIYVTDKLNNRVQKFTLSGAYIGQFGNNALFHPTGLAIGQDMVDTVLIKYLYVSDTKHNRVVKFAMDGSLADSLAYDIGLNQAWDICLDNAGNLFIADVHNSRVVALDPCGSPYLTFGSQGSGPGQFNMPQGLAVSPDGRYLYVVDTHNNRVQRFEMFFDSGTGGGAQFAGVRKVGLPTAFKLGQSYPNPTSFDAIIDYALPNQARVKLNIYNTLGQKVRTLVQENQMPGYYSIKWDSKDDAGMKAAGGVYFYRLTAGDHSATKKMVVLK